MSQAPVPKRGRWVVKSVDFRGLAVVLLAMLALALGSCRKTPGGVIEPDPMADILADLYTAEAFVDQNHSRYSSVDDLIRLREGIYQAHGVSTAEVDSSLMWYGSHPDVFLQVCDNTIAILEERLGSTPQASAQGFPVAPGVVPSLQAEGNIEEEPAAPRDSAEIWTGPRTVAVNPRSPSRFMTFDIPLSNIKRNRTDRYTLKLNIPDNEVEARFYMLIDYADNTTEFVTSHSNARGWRQISITTDSMRVPLRLYGNVEIVMPPKASTRIDSISLMREAADSRMYQRRFRQQSIRLQ